MFNIPNAYFKSPLGNRLVFTSFPVVILVYDNLAYSSMLQMPSVVLQEQLASSCTYQRYSYSLCFNQCQKKWKDSAPSSPGCDSRTESDCFLVHGYTIDTSAGPGFQS